MNETVDLHSRFRNEGGPLHTLAL